MSLRVLLATLALCLGFIVTPAHAKRGIGIINTGDEMFEVAPLPAALNPLEKGPVPQVGYLCNHFGIFWADVWTWGCKLVAIEGENSYSDLPSEITTQLAADPAFRFSKAKRGFWNHYAFWTALAGVGTLFVFGLFAKKKEDEAGDTLPTAAV